MSRHNALRPEAYDPPRCWVGDTQKIIYATREEAEVAARIAERDHGAPHLGVYRCPYADHYHLTSA